MVKKIISIDWKNASFVFNNKNKKFLQTVESALISKLPHFNLSSGFYSLPDDIAQDIISELHIQLSLLVFYHPGCPPCRLFLSIIHYASGADA